MGVARGDPPSREHKATHNSSTIEDKNPGNKKKKKKMEVVGSMLASCTLVVRGGGMVGKGGKNMSRHQVRPKVSGLEVTSERLHTVCHKSIFRKQNCPRIWFIFLRNGTFLVSETGLGQILAHWPCVLETSFLDFLGFWHAAIDKNDVF